VLEADSVYLKQTAPTEKTDDENIVITTQVISNIDVVKSKSKPVTITYSIKLDEEEIKSQSVTLYNKRSY